MQNDNLNVDEAMGAGIVRNMEHGDVAPIKGHYTFECRDKDGNLKWADEIKNVVCTLGKNELLDKYLSGSSWTAAMYMGLISSVSFTTGPVIGDTMASHAGWFEAGAANLPTYSQANRPTITFNNAASGNKSSNGSVTFSITGNGTVTGAFINSGNSVKDATGNILFSAGNFTGGNKVVSNGDTLSGTYTLSI